MGLLFGTLGLHFGVFWEALAPLGAHLGHFGGIGRKMVSLPNRSGTPFATWFRAQIRQSPPKSANSVYPESSPEKSRHPTPPKVAQCGFCAVINICVERPNQTHSEGFWLTFGYLLGSLLGTLGHKWAIVGLKKRSPKSDQKRSEKVTQESASQSRAGSVRP